MKVTMNYYPIHAYPIGLSSFS